MLEQREFNFARVPLWGRNVESGGRNMKATFSIMVLVLLLLTSGINAQQPGGTPPAVGIDPVITDSTGLFSVGIGPDGELYDSSSGIGFQRLSDSYDPLAPGSPRDSWGVTANTTSAYADQAELGTVGVSSIISNTANSATVTTTTGNDLTVVQNDSFAAPNMLEINTTITNNAASATDIVFQRDIDWDVLPIEFDENSFGNAITGNVTDSSYYGFENPDPAAVYNFSCAAGCNQTGDLGGGIKIDLGTVAAGGSVSFTYLYGISQTGENVNGLIAQADGLGAYYYVATQSSEAGAYPDLGTNSAIIAVSSVVPEPSSWALLLTVVGGLGLLGLKRRRSA
jgi:hypothetical protein